ncbi:MAG: TetR/AcrR family transcriptional regulator [Pseudomonadota bacterium]
MPALSPERLRARREEILLAALRCFGRQGYEATSMRDLSSEAGVSIGGLYTHFESKEAVLQGVASLFRERERDALKERTPTAPSSMSALVDELWVQYDTAYTSNRDALKTDILLLGEAIRLPPLRDVLSERDRQNIRYTETSAEAVEELRDDARQIAILLTAFSYGIAILDAFHDDVEPSECFETLRRMLSVEADQ